MAGDFKICFFGFDDSALPDSEARSDHNLSMHEVRRHPRIDPRSDVIGDAFQLLADRGSVAWEQMAALGTFDVVNLDLCGHLVAEPPSRSSLYNALHNVVSHQARRTEPWSLLLTMRVRRDGIFAPIGEEFAAELARVLRECASLPSIVDEQIDDSYTRLADEGSNLESLSDSELVYAFLLSAVLWLRNLANPRSCALTVDSVYVYRVASGSPAPDMVSLVIRFEPLVGAQDSDPMGLSTVPLIAVDECDEVIDLADILSTDMVDIDEVLSLDASLLNDLIDQSVGLLVGARYSEADYRAWVADGCPSQGPD